MSARKYRQKGYQDDGEPSPQGSRQSGGRSEGPRGRGLGAPTTSKLRCSRCGAAVGEEPKPEAVCKSCGSDLHTCTNCRHFDTSARFECRKPIEKRVPSKAKNNECDEYEPKLVQEFAPESRSPTASGAKKAFDDLFDF